MRPRTFICPLSSPCYKCTEKVLPDETQNGCKPTCKKYADFRAAADQHAEQRKSNADLASMEFDRVHKIKANYRRKK